MKEQHKIGACLHQVLNLRNENLLSTPVRQCTWSARRTWMMLKRIPSRKRSPMNVITANGEVQTQEEATIHVKELDIILTMKVRKNTPKLCDENGYSYEWINGQTKHLIQNGSRIPCNTENFVPIVFPDLIRQLQGHFQDRRVIPHHLLHLQQVKFRLENERIELRVTSLQ